MKLIVFLLISLAVFSKDEHREQGIIEKSYFHDLPPDYDKNPSDLVRDFQLHCESSEGSRIDINESECLEILNDGKPKGFSEAESQCVFTYKIDAECMDKYLDRSNDRDDICSEVVKGRFKSSSGSSLLQITIGWNNIRKRVEDPLDSDN